MPELQEVPEEAFFRAAKGRHLGAGRRAAEHRDEGDDEQLAKVVARIVGAGIGDVIEGGEEDVHGGSGLRAMNLHPEVIRCDQGAVSAHFRSSRIRAFARIRSLRITAVIATFAGFPALQSA